MVLVLLGKQYLLCLLPEECDLSNIFTITVKYGLCLV